MFRKLKRGSWPYLPLRALGSATGTRLRVRMILLPGLANSPRRRNSHDDNTTSAPAFGEELIGSSKPSPKTDSTLPLVTNSQAVLCWQENAGGATLNQHATAQHSARYRNRRHM